MVKIRLTRLGKHKKPFFRIVVIDSRRKRDSSYLALLGNYEPFTQTVNIDEEAALKYLNQGAQPSDTILAFLKKKGIWAKYMNQKTQKSKASVAK